MDPTLKSVNSRQEHKRSSSLGIVSGLRACAGGIGFVARTPAVWPFAAVPIGLMTVLTCGFGVFGVWGAIQASHYFFGEAASFWGHAGSWLTTGLLSVAALVLAILLGFSLAQPLSGFALEAIVRQQERALTGKVVASPGSKAGLLASLKIAAFTLIVGGFVLTALFFVDLVFPPATIVTVPLKFVFCGWLFAWDLLDYPLGLRGLGVRDRLHWVRRNLGAFTTFGIATTMSIIVPGTVLLLLPMGVAGATQLVIEDERQGT